MPSAYTQPLYGWFLAGLYWALGRSWPAVGVAQALVAAATALLVYEIGRRAHSHAAGLVGALLATLHPYLVWHDVHVNREILDGLLAAALVLLVLVARTVPATVALGVVAGLAVLGNSRLVLLPLLVAAAVALLQIDTRRWLLAATVVAAAAVTVAPWVLRNERVVGCAAITTDARALWKANNPHTYATLAAGKWIDDVPELPGAPLTPEFAAALAKDRGRPFPVDECEQMRLYRDEVLDFWREQPGEKARLAGQATLMLWSPRVTVAAEGEKNAGLGGAARSWVEPAFMVALYALALVGAWLGPRRFVGVAVALLAYQTLMAMVFAGTVRYRAPWDFLVALLAAIAVVELARRRRRRPDGAEAQAALRAAA